jgi:hypothetical protein
VGRGEEAQRATGRWIDCAGGLGAIGDGERDDCRGAATAAARVRAIAATATTTARICRSAPAAATTAAAAVGWIATPTTAAAPCIHRTPIGGVSTTCAHGIAVVIGTASFIGR